MTSQKPPITGTTHTLPYGSLSADKFEELCLWLVRREGYPDAEHLGAAGSEQGRDIRAWRQGKQVVFQCKRVEKFGPQDALKEINKILGDPHAVKEKDRSGLPEKDRPAELIFIVTRDVGIQTRTAAQERWGDPKTCKFWALTELDEMVKRHPDIVSEFFTLAGADPAKAQRLKALRESYLNHVLEKAGYLSLAGIDPKAASQAEARLSLSAVYTALLTQALEETTPEKKRSASPERSPRRLSALEMLDRQQRLVLLGDPGSGKSTFVNFVALCLAGEALKQKDVNLKLLTAPLPPEEDDRLAPPEEKKPKKQSWQHGALLPVRIVLRDFAARGLPAVGERATASHLWSFIVAELGAAQLGDYSSGLEDELREKGGLILLDGLDEVPEAEQRRVQIKQCIEDFAAAYPRCRYLVTSRTYAYQNQDWQLARFENTTLAPFSRGQIRQFVDHWYAHIAILRDLDPQDAQGRAERLKGAILGNDRLYGLAERPLLLTLMASLHAWRGGGALPEKREELYANTVDLLLDWWESPKAVLDARGEANMRQPSLAEWLKIDRQKVRLLLNELAYKAHAAQPDIKGTADISEADLVAGLMRLSLNPDVRPARLVEYLSTRAGLLLPHGVGVYTFPHRTFQEYLAACFLKDHEYPELVAELACSDLNRWREATLLVGAMLGRGPVWELAEELCLNEIASQGPAAEIPLPDWNGALLAGQTLAENIDPADVSRRNRPKLERVQQWLVQIMRRSPLPAVERSAAGDALAALGDPRFDPEHFHLPAEPLLGFVPIPAGPFRMGSDPSKDRFAQKEEQDQHEVTLPDYYLARYPVTNLQFAAFVRLGGYADAHYWPEAKAAKIWKDGAVKGHFESQPRQGPLDYGQPFNLSNHPVVGVTWYEALAYCRWLGEQLSAISGQRSAENGLPPQEAAFWHGLAQGKLVLGLPSEAEWEKAARASPPPGVRLFPWGDDLDPDKANTSETGLGATSAVGCFPGGASPYGLLDMSGNTWEWTRSLWGKGWQKPDFGYPYTAADGREALNAGDRVLRVLRGGAFNNGAAVARCACRNRLFMYFQENPFGFRVGAFGAFPGS